MLIRWKVEEKPTVYKKCIKGQWIKKKKFKDSLYTLVYLLGKLVSTVFVLDLKYSDKCIMINNNWVIFIFEDSNIVIIE